jgi:hypothetical protein
MAAQLLALPALAKALAYAKGLAGIGAKTIGPKLGAQVAGQAARSSAKKFAGNALAKAGTLVPKNVGEATRFIVGDELYNNKKDLIYRLAPDAFFGVVGGAMTPGDLGDKVIAGGTQFLGGGLTGIAAGRGARALNMGTRAADMADMIGSVGGDFLGMAVGDQILRAKGGGMTPMEQQMMEQDALYRAQLEQEFLQKYGYNPAVDPVMASNGLAA